MRIRPNLACCFGSIRCETAAPHHLQRTLRAEPVRDPGAASSYCRRAACRRFRSTAPTGARARRLTQLDALAGYKTYKTIEEFDHHLERSLRKLIERRVKALENDAAATTQKKGAPFRGRRSYEFDDAEIFHGCNGLAAQAIERLAKRAHGGVAFLLVSGPSGSGKSSLVKAALVPRLMKPARRSYAARCFVRARAMPRGRLVSRSQGVARVARAETGRA
jgi:hypothetical protein